jgi:hypothetical protein
LDHGLENLLKGWLIQRFILIKRWGSG